MPRKDGTGPTGQGPAGGGMGRGGRGGGFAAGPAGMCVCPKCKEQVAHTTGVPCASMLCPKCGTAMTRAV